MAQPVVSPTVWVDCAAEPCIKAATAIAARNAMSSPLAIDNVFAEEEIAPVFALLFLCLSGTLFFLAIKVMWWICKCASLFHTYRESPGLDLNLWVILGHLMENTCAILGPWSGNSDSSKVGLLKVGRGRNSWVFAAWEARTHQTEWL